MHCLQIAPNEREKQQLMWRQKQNWKTFLAFQKGEFCTKKNLLFMFFSFSWNSQTMALKWELTTEIYFLSPKRTPRCGAIVVVVIVNVVADDEEKHVSKFVASSRQANVDASIEKYMPWVQRPHENQ